MEDFKYYTLVGINLSRGKDMIPKFSRDFIMRWTTNEKDKANLANEMVKNKLYETSEKEAIEAVRLSEAYDLTGIRMRMRFCPEITAHLYETEFVLTDEWLDILIESANVSDYGKKQLAESQIRI
jgi:hypothetical protein